MARVRRVKPFLIWTYKTWLEKFLYSLLTKRSVTWFHNTQRPSRWCDDAWHFHSCGRHVAIQCLFSVERHPDRTEHSSRRKSQLTQARKPDPTLHLWHLCIHTHLLHECERLSWSHSLLCDAIIMVLSLQQSQICYHFIQGQIHLAEERI